MHEYINNHNINQPKKSKVVGISSEANPENTMFKVPKSPKEPKPANKRSDLKSDQISKRKQKATKKVNKTAQAM